MDGYILWHINPCSLFNAKLYIYDLATNSLSVTLLLNEPELICLHIVEWFQVLLSNTSIFLSVSI